MSPRPRLRYILMASGDRWLIHRVDIEFSKERGWVRQEDLNEERKAILLMANRSRRPFGNRGEGLR